MGLFSRRQPSYNEGLAVGDDAVLDPLQPHPETWARLAEKPEDRREAAHQYIEAVGRTLHGFWYAFGEYDAYNLCEAPDNVSMAAVAMAISGGGALSKYETTVLLTVEETMDAMAPGARHPIPPAGNVALRGGGCRSHRRC